MCMYDYVTRCRAKADTDIVISISANEPFFLSTTRIPKMTCLGCLVIQMLLPFLNLVASVSQGLLFRKQGFIIGRVKFNRSPSSL